MKKIRVAALLLAGLMIAGSTVACTTEDDTIPDDEVTTQDRTPSGDEETTKKAGGNDTTDEKDPFSGNDQNGDEETTTENSGNEAENPALKYNILSIGGFHDGLAVISTDQGYGYITPQGSIAIEPIYEMASDFDTLALVRYQGTLQYIDRSGSVVYTHAGKDSDLGAYKNGFFWVRTIEETLAGNIPTMTYFDQNGQKVFSVESATEAIQKAPQNNLNAWNKIQTSMSSFNEYGYTIVEIDDKNKLIDTKGQIVSMETFGIDIDNYKITKQLGPIVVISGTETSGEAYFLDYAGKTSYHLGSYQSAIVYDPPVLHLLENYYVAYSRSTYNKQYSEIYRQGEKILNFKDIPDLAGAKVKAVSMSEVDSKLYLILYVVNGDGVFFSIISDTEGHFVATPTKQYNLGYQSLSLKDGAYYYEDFEAYTFHSGLCKAQETETGLFGYIDLAGNWVIPAQYEKVTDFQGEGDDAIAIVNGNTIINRKGEVIFSINE